MILDQTNRILPMAEPGSYFARRGLGDAAPMDTGGFSLNSIVTAFNAELVFFENMRRARQGLPPLDTSAVAPTVNVGVTRETQTAVGLALAVGLIAVFALRK